LLLDIIDKPCWLNTLPFFYPNLGEFIPYLSLRSGCT
jgi:hypothetical protein